MHTLHITKMAAGVQHVSCCDCFEDFFFFFFACATMEELGLEEISRIKHAVLC